jgi:hypothetical protein
MNAKTKSGVRGEGAGGVISSSNHESVNVVKWLDDGKPFAVKPLPKSASRAMFEDNTKSKLQGQSGNGTTDPSSQFTRD